MRTPPAPIRPRADSAADRPPEAADGSGRAARPPRPNLLLVFSDQHRWCDLGCAGNRDLATPEFDAFARSAAHLRACISNSPLCVPARGSLLTGLMPLRHGAAANDLPLRPGLTGLGHVLRAAGYRTGYIGKWHLAGVPRDQHVPAGDARLGFETWKVCNCSHDYLHAWYHDEEGRRIAAPGYEPEVQTDLALDFVARGASPAGERTAPGSDPGPRPWALVLSWGPPHDPYHAVPARFLAPYATAPLHLRANVPDVVRPNLARTVGRPEVLHWHRGYYAHLAALDEQFGRLVTALDRSGQAERTVVVYTSDHGDMLGSHGHANKQLPFEESIRVPLLARWPGHTFTGGSDALIGLVDLAPSLLGLMGLSFPQPTDGIDRHRVFVDPQAPGADACYIADLIPCHQAAARGGQPWRGLRTARHTFVRGVRDPGFALYDNAADPHQLRNLIDRPEAAAVCRDLRARLDAEVARHDALLPWEDLIRASGLREAWNRSQAYFRLPQLP